MRPWPEELGTLEEVPARFPERESSADALRVADLARPLGIHFEPRNSSERAAVWGAIREFLEAETARDVAAVGDAPASVTEFLATHAADIDALRAHLEKERDITWTVDLDEGYEAPLPNLLAHVNVGRLFVVRALIRARSGDAAAWDDLRAASMLGRSLHERPELVSQLIALYLARIVNAASWKLPLPAPSWLDDIRHVDHRKLVLQALQFETWQVWRFAPEKAPLAFVIGRPYVYASAANLALHQRETAIELLRTTDCRFDGKRYSEQRRESIPWWSVPARVASVEIGSVWSRVRRYEAEREAVANALRVRAGQPIVAESRCSDGTWRQNDGVVAFTIDIPDPMQRRMPLRLHVVADDAPAGDHDLHLER